MEKKSTSPTSTKAPSVASFAPSRKSRGGGGGSVFGEEKRTMSMKDVLVWRKITKRWHDRVMERNSSRNGGFCWWDQDGQKRRGRKAEPKKEPTYRMEPQKFPVVSDLLLVVKNYLEERLKEESYCEETSKKLTMQIADELKDKLKKCQWWPERYKCIVYVTMGQKKGQGVRVSSRCAWDTQFDRSISHTFQNENIFCSATAFAVYCE